MANAAALKAAWNVLRGHRIDRWVPVRDADPAVAAGHSVDASDSRGR
jgi:hypothetical protein